MFDGYAVCTVNPCSFKIFTFTLTLFFNYYSFYSDSKKLAQYGFRCGSCESLHLSWSNAYFRKQRIKLIDRSKKLVEYSKIASGDILVDITSKVTSTKL